MNHNQSTDAELVAATLDGSRDAFGALVERHQQFVCALAYSKTGSRATSEDIAQETFLSAWKNLAKLRAPGNFRGWLCGMVRNLAARFACRQQESAPLPEDVAAPVAAADEIMTREEESLLWATLERLPEEYREPLVLFHRGGQSVREIAGLLELSEDAAKQRLSRGRTMLQEAVRDQVETALTRSRPGAAFTIAVMAAIPALTSTAQAAGTGLTVAKGAGAVAIKGLLPILGGAVIGILGAWLGVKSSLNRAESERERRFIKRAGWWAMASVAAMMAGLWALIFWSGPMLASRPVLWIALLAGLILVFAASNVVFAVVNSRKQWSIRAEERLARDLPADKLAPRAFEYRSRATLLGLPLVHVRFGGSSGLGVARGWIAYGAVAVAPLFACGGVAIGGIACGGVSVGILSTAAIGIGVISFSGMAFGGIVLGGIAVGWIALGGAALGWLAAYGGLAKAGIYGCGGRVFAPHANDAIAKTFFQESGLFHVLRFVADHGILLQLAIFLPMLILSLWANHCMRKTKQ